MVSRVKDYPWSRHREYLSEGESWVCSSFALAVLERNKSAQRKSYIRFVNKDEAETITGFYSRKNRSSILGKRVLVKRSGSVFFDGEPMQRYPRQKDCCFG
jgi:hypothetical protein